MGWMFSHPAGQERERMARDLSQDRLVRFIDRTFLLWAVLGFVLPFALGFALTGTWRGALTGLLWGGLVRLFLNHHVTWSVNSICHYFGRRPFPAYDLSTNNWLLALPSLGESWHHNHHVFPTSAFHGLGKMQLDASGLMIRAWEKMGWVTQVRRPTSDQILRKLGRGD
jgi:stearoyl-CoA desaturase (delta-9 desaturase)